jgi:hypothetical protein
MQQTTQCVTLAVSLCPVSCVLPSKESWCSLWLTHAIDSFAQSASLQLAIGFSGRIVVVRCNGRAARLRTLLLGKADGRSFGFCMRPEQTWRPRTTYLLLAVVCLARVCGVCASLLCWCGLCTSVIRHCSSLQVPSQLVCAVPSAVTVLFLLPAAAAQKGHTLHLACFDADEHECVRELVLEMKADVNVRSKVPWLVLTRPVGIRVRATRLEAGGCVVGCSSRACFRALIPHGRTVRLR